MAAMVSAGPAWPSIAHTTKRGSRTPWTAEATFTKWSPTTGTHLPRIWKAGCATGKRRIRSGRASSRLSISRRRPTRRARPYWVSDAPIQPSQAMAAPSH